MFVTKILIIFVTVVLCVLLVESAPAVNNGNQNPTSMCTLPPVKGHCRALIPRWRYNPTTGKCQEFYFGGCDGNANNFESYKACMSVCEGIS